MGAKGSKKEASEDLSSFKALRKERREKGCCRVVVVGDGGVGKSTMLIRYFEGIFPEAYIPTIYENQDRAEKRIKGDIVNFEIDDTAGGEGYPDVRRLLYKDADIFLLCLSTVDSYSIGRIKDYWVPELITYTPQNQVCCVLVGCKTDLHGEEETKTIFTLEEGQTLAQQVGAYDYVQCSAKTPDNIPLVFETIWEAMLCDSPPLLHLPNEGYSVKKAKK